MNWVCRRCGGWCAVTSHHACVMCALHVREGWGVSIEIASGVQVASARMQLSRRRVLQQGRVRARRTRAVVVAHATLVYSSHDAGESGGVARVARVCGNIRRGLCRFPDVVRACVIACIVYERCYGVSCMSQGRAAARSTSFVLWDCVAYLGCASRSVNIRA